MWNEENLWNADLVTFTKETLIENFIFCAVVRPIRNSQRKIPLFHLISWCGSVMETQSFCTVLCDSPKTLRKVCVSTTFPHQEICWSFGCLKFSIEQTFRKFNNFFIEAGVTEAFFCKILGVVWFKISHIPEAHDTV